jgi:ligand-binding sensor domain-containing protein
MNYINRCIHIPLLIVLYSLLIVGKLAADGDLFQTNSGYTLKFEHLSLDQGLSQVTVNTIIQDHRGFIWFATRDGLNRFDGYHFRIYRHNPFDSTSISNNRVNVLYEDHEGYLWVGTDEGLNRYDRDGDTFLSFKRDMRSPNSISDNRITALVEDQMGNLWIGTAKGVDQLNKNRNLFRYPGFEETRETEANVRSVTALYEDSRGRIWLGTQQSGLYILDPQGEVFSLFQHKNLPSTFFVNNKINTLFGEIIRKSLDRHDQWFGTLSDGPRSVTNLSLLKDL